MLLKILLIFFNAKTLIFISVLPVSSTMYTLMFVEVKKKKSIVFPLRAHSLFKQIFISALCWDQ